MKTVMMLIFAFVGMLVLFQLVPQIIDANTLIQADTDAGAITKLAADIGEWLFMLGGVMACIWVVVKHVRG